MFARQLPGFVNTPSDTCRGNCGICWVARAVYGEENPRWLLFRDWLLADAPAWFRGLYLRHGEHVARWIAPHAAVKSIIRLWMDSVIDRRPLASSQPNLTALRA